MMKKIIELGVLFFLLIIAALIITNIFGCGRFDKQYSKVLSPESVQTTTVTCHTFAGLPFLCIEKKDTLTDVIEIEYVKVKVFVEKIVEIIVIEEKIVEVPVEKIVYIVEERVESVPNQPIEAVIETVIAVVEAEVPSQNIVKYDAPDVVESVLESVASWSPPVPSVPVSRESESPPTKTVPSVPMSRETPTETGQTSTKTKRQLPDKQVADQSIDLDDEFGLRGQTAKEFADTFDDPNHDNFHGEFLHGSTQELESHANEEPHENNSHPHEATGRHSHSSQTHSHGRYAEHTHSGISHGVDDQAHQAKPHSHHTGHAINPVDDVGDGLHVHETVIHEHGGPEHIHDGHQHIH